MLMGKYQKAVSSFLELTCNFLQLLHNIEGSAETGPLKRKVCAQVVMSVLEADQN